MERDPVQLLRAAEGDVAVVAASAATPLER
jgi:hypothetical protein